MPDVAALLRSALAPEQMQLLRRAAEESARRGVRLYLVGGAVRDALLGLPVADIDLVSAPGGADFGRELAGALGGEVVASSQFGTHKIMAGGITFDLAMARTESYDHPGALPSVRPAGILDDLARRDFTINAMAVEVRGESWGDLQDEFGGLADLRRGLVRTLHDGSFRDDATRILRAARYAGRYGYRIEAATQRALDRDLAYLDAIKGDRLRHELERVFDEPRAAPILRLLRDAGVLHAINPSLGADEAVLAQIDEIAIGPERGPTPVMLSLLVSSLPAEAASALARRLNMGAGWSRVVRDTIALRDVLGRLKRSGLRPSEVGDLLSTYDEHVLRAGAALASDELAASWVRRYLDELRHVRPLLDGNDLLALGVERGPDVGALLRALRRARLDGEVHTREDEVAYARARFGEDETSLLSP